MSTQLERYHRRWLRTQNEFTLMRQQRDELLVALEALLEHSIPTTERTVSGYAITKVAAVAGASALIAKIKGGV